MVVEEEEEEEDEGEDSSVSLPIPASRVALSGARVKFSAPNKHNQVPVQSRYHQIF